MNISINEKFVPDLVDKILDNENIVTKLTKYLLLNIVFI